MRAIYFFNPAKKAGKYFLALMLGAKEFDALADAGGFDEAINTSGWISERLKSGGKFGRYYGYLLRDYLERLDFIRDRLTETFGWKCRLKNILTTPTVADLIAWDHPDKDHGKIRLYLPNDSRGLIYASYVAKIDAIEKFLDLIRGRRAYIRQEKRYQNQIVVRGYYLAGFIWLKKYCEHFQIPYPEVKVVDAVGYDQMLLKHSAKLV